MTLNFNLPPKNNEAVHKLMEHELIVTQECIEDLIGLAIIKVNKDGSINEFSTFCPGGKLPLFAGLGIAQHSLYKMIVAMEEGYPQK